NAGELDVRVELIVSSHPQARGLQYATEAAIPSRVIERRGHSSDASFGQAIFDACRAADVDLVVMGGFLKFAPIPDDFAGRVVNIHPSLIPAFCGHKMYGHFVHEAVL